MTIDTRQILILITVIVVIFMVTILSVVGIYFYKPSVLGFPDDIHKSDTVNTELKIFDLPVTEMVNVSKNRLEFYEKMLKEKKILEKEKDSLIQTTDFLNDSLMSIYSKKLKSDSLKIISDELLNDTLVAISKLNDSIFTLNINLKKTENKLKDLEKTVENQEDYIIQEADSLEQVNFGQFAKIYNNTNPQEVAKILEQIDERDAAKILKQMSNKQAGKVLEAMTPENAAAILLLGAGK
jgi:dTDP-glucose pyrophosphorylase